jgi:hypothetical protein
MSRAVLRAVLLSSLAVAVNHAIGCGGSAPPGLSGTVKHKGTTVSGTLVIKSSSAEKSAIVGPAGEYTMVDPPTGDCKIALTTDNPKFPAKYKSIAQTTYRETISPGQKVLDLNFP